MKKCNILCGGIIEDVETTSMRADKDAYTICADSGYAYAEKLGLRPDAVLGDFDSFALEKVKEENITVYPMRKDYTDSEIAVMHAIEQGFDEIVLFGALGGRLDHALGNLHLLRYIYQAGATGTIVDGNTQVWYATTGREINGKKGDILSIVPISSGGRFTLRGLEYPLTEEKLPLSGISNVFTQEKVLVEAHDAEFLIIHITL